MVKTSLTLTHENIVIDSSLNSVMTRDEFAIHHIIAHAAACVTEGCEENATELRNACKDYSFHYTVDYYPAKDNADYNRKVDDYLRLWDLNNIPSDDKVARLLRLACNALHRGNDGVRAELKKAVCDYLREDND